ncbi:MAG: protein kinase domain-containing protein [Deltaproteobacteria bacterium]
MPHQRAPWWMYVVAVSYLSFLIFVLYSLATGPDMHTGLAADFGGGAMTVKSVVPHGYADQAGVRVGDQIRTVDGQDVRSVQDWLAIRANTVSGRPQHWDVLRAGQKLQLTVTFPHLSTQYGPAYVAHTSWILTTLLLGLLIAFRRPNDRVARAGAWLSVSASFAFGFADGWAAVWRALPVGLGLLLWIPALSRLVIDGIAFTFFAVFPQRLFRARWPWAAIWAPVLAPLPWRISALYAEIYRPGHATGAPPWVFSTMTIRTVVYLAACLAVLSLNYYRLQEVNQRRRIRVLATGAGVSLLAAIAWQFTPGRWLVFVNWAWVSQSVLFLFMLAFPVSLAYAILRHRMFDLGVMIRQGVQYAMARGVVLSLVPALGAVLVGDLLLHGDQPLIQVLAARGWVYAALGGLALLAHTQRTKWMQALDRRFFREHYDAQRLLREIVDEIRQGGSLERVAPRTVASIEAALHPEFASLLALAPGEKSYRSLAAAPAGQSPPPLSADSKLAALVRVLGKPLETPHSESGWLQQQLPHEETDFLRRARIDLLVPVSVAPGGIEALLALGVKKSEEPYSREDQELLEAIAASLALLVAKPAAAPESSGDTFEECPECGACYDTGSSQCTRDNAGLTVMRLPRLLAGRYRLDHRRGRGGMGAVYEALDTGLERRVAVKVIRDELVGNAEAAERFQREARAAASFTHPNVVTIYDFGVAETRAFLVMELLEGVALRDELKRGGRLASERVLSLMRGICSAVEAAHRRQLVHRDLKPENIFLARGEFGEIPKVLDFGIAKFLPQAAAGESLAATADTGTGALLGTVRYMSPEQLRGGKVGTGWDLWALAVIAYETLVGTHPFAGASATAAEFHAGILSGKFTPVSTHATDAPPAWQEFFAYALSLDASARPASAQEFFSQLELALAV